MAGDLGVALNTALSGLQINQQQLSVLSQNIANANTQGYSQESLTQTAISLNGTGEGVTSGEVTRQVNQYLISAAQGQNSNVGQSGAINNYYNQIQLLLGTPGSNNSIDSYINSFFNSVQSLAESPNSATAQQIAVNSGVTLANQTQQLANGLQNLQNQADQDIGTSIITVNSDLVNINKLNSAIVSATSQGQSTASLDDQRDSILQDLSQYIDIKTFNSNNGSVNITTGNGITILGGNNLYQFQYNPLGNQAAFGNGTSLSPITLSAVDSNLNPIGLSTNVTSGGLPTSETTVFTSGKVAGLISMRDQLIPNIMSQLDTLASTVTTQVNAINNAGSSFPGSNSLTGETSVFPQSTTQWSGQAQIAVLGQNGQPIASPYSDEPNGVPPLTLNLATLNTGSGAGNPSVQGIINQINQYYGVPQNKAEVGNLNNVQLVSASSSIPNTLQNFDFGLNLNNISATSSNVYVTGVTVTPNTGGTPAVTSTIPSIALASTNTYTMIPSVGSTSSVIVRTNGTNNLTNGEIVYLSTPPGGPYNGIDASNLGGYFKVSNVTSTGFQITVQGTATSGNADGGSGLTALPPYATVPAGGSLITNSNGIFNAALAGTTGAQYYTVTVSVGVDDGSGNIKTSNVTYQVNNNQSNILGTVFGAQSADGEGQIVAPNTTTALATATLVDANGNPIPSTNGVYDPTIPGYLKITAGNSTNTIAIGSLNSQTPPPPAAGQGFSDYFGLNNFFVPNSTVANSAINMQVNSNLVNNPGSISLGQLSQSPSSTAAGALPNYTYQLNAGDNSVIQQLAGLAANATNFAATGGLGASTQTYSSYAGEIIGTASTNTATSKTNNTNDQSLLTGLTTQASALSGVNLDTELANTVVYQNAYSASARIISIVGTLFDALMQSI